MNKQIIARRYASALLQQMEDEAAARACQQELEVAAEVLTTRQVRNALECPAFSPEDQALVLKDLTTAMKVSVVLDRFLQVLFGAGRIVCLPELTESFGALLEERFRVRRAVVHAAAPLGDALEEKLKKCLEAHTGDRVEIQFVKDPELIAGWRARVGNYLIEADLRTRGRRIRECLVKG